MIYVYAILDGRAAIGGDGVLLGREGKPVVFLPQGRVSVAASRHAVPPSCAATPENLWQHEDFVERLMESQALLPARFGTIFPDEQRLNASVARHHDRLLEGINAVRGCVEIGVRCVRDPNDLVAAATTPANHRPSSGREYMLARAAEERRRGEADARAVQLFERFHHPLAVLSRDTRIRPLRAGDSMVSAAYLVERRHVDQFHEQVQSLSEASPHARLLCTGPWPPYHFVPALEGVAAGHGDEP